MKTFPKKFMDRVPTYLYPITAFTMITVAVNVTLKADHDEETSHRF
jgi:hypothetical protein